MAGPARTAARHRTKSAEAGVVRHHTVCWTPTPAHVYIYTPASIGSKGGEARAAAGTHLVLDQDVKRHTLLAKLGSPCSDHQASKHACVCMH
ncbi:hypothetical protein BRADI_2g44065v3 [Brachypodium distachyon]|uniref:Uncharacterized protein n=1 Tax=Brachypodium distachyon TaxID=15368 RepID=A0A2K2DDR5_BRADI|nr:hypothetical protein BRADI_2g44065v3 [Brachypodium distachyon]